MDRSFMIIAAVAAIVILLDEWAYHYWKAANPGHMFSDFTEPTPLAIHPGMSNYKDVVKTQQFPEPFPYRVRGVNHYAAW